MLYDQSKLRRGLLTANLILLFAAATLCRALLLDHLPGLNGDEAWQGVQVQRWLRGEAVSWRTPTGNPINPLSFLPMAALHNWLPPSITLLRLTPLLSGLAALAVNFWLCRRVFDRQLALVSTVILAVLPVMVAYSRFAWDASQSVLVTLPVMYGALGAVRDPIHRRRWLLGSVAAFVLAVLVHPTNVFIAPLIVAAAVWCWRKELRAVGETLRRSRLADNPFSRPIRWLAMAVFLGVLLGGAGAASRSSTIAAAAERLVSPSQATLFFERVVDLLSGTTVYRYIPATQLQATEPATFAYCLAAWIALAAAAYGLFHYLRRRRHASIRVLLVGFGAGLTAFYVVAGPQALRPHFERYGIWMIGPTALLLALGVRWWMQSANSLGRLRPALALLLAWAMLGSFGWYYLRPLSQGLGNAHVAFRTAQVDPKLAALRLIDSQGTEAFFGCNALASANPTCRKMGLSPWGVGVTQGDSPRVEIVAHGWWVYWPLAYLAGADSRWSIVPENVPGEVRSSNRGEKRAWQVSWIDDPEGEDRAPGAAQSLSLIVSDAAGRPLLRVVRPGATETMTPPASLR